MKLFNVLFFSLLFGYVTAFADYLLKSCNEAGFCVRNREYAANIINSKASYYSIDPKSIDVDDSSGTLSANIIKTIKRPDRHTEITLPLKISFLKSHGASSKSYFRFTIDELRQNVPQSNLLNKYRYNETAKWAFDPSKQWDNSHFTIEKKIKNGKKGIDQFLFGSTSKDEEYYLILPRDDENMAIELFLDSFQINVLSKGKLVMSINEYNLMNFEHFRSIEDNFQNLLEEESTFNMFKDNFRYSQDDKIPFGPESVGIDFVFKNAKAVYGIPEHADSLKLKDTRETDPYRLFNVDVFEYFVDSPSPMYGAIPFMFGVSKDVTTGLFWVNSADTWIDIHYSSVNTDQVNTHWFSENGVIDVVVFVAENPSDILEQYTDLTGRPFLPLQSSIGYHQCRWNYNDEYDVLSVQNEMDKAHIPFDIIWLDLEYTDDRKYFTWKDESFPNPRRLLEKLSQFGRQLVVLIDPHLKSRGNKVSDAVVKGKGATKNKKGRLFLGECWPGQSIWIDTMGQIGRKLWKGFFNDFLYKGLSNLHIWNDMNEPSVFSGPETTAPKDVIHAGGFEERSIHNVYGLTVHETTFNATREFYSDSETRPFVLTRSFFAGSQRTAATWTGDNVANWDYLRISIPMCLSNNVAGFPFIGADVAGFSGNPEPELLVRWYQAGLWYPFFRAHAHIDSVRREPYLFDGPVRNMVKDTIRLRYRLLPTFYTAFYESSRTGAPIMKPLFFDYFAHEELLAIDDQFFVGNSGIMVKPIVQKGVKETTVTFPPKLYYDYETFALVNDDVSAITNKQVSATLDTIPIFLEGGHILFQKEKYRRSSELMSNDPYTIVIIPDENGIAIGNLYVDDGKTFAYSNNEFLKTTLKFTSDGLFNRPHSEGNLSATAINTNVTAIKIVTSGLESSFKKQLISKFSSDDNLNTNVESNHIVMKIRYDMSKPWDFVF